MSDLASSVASPSIPCLFWLSRIEHQANAERGEWYSGVLRVAWARPVEAEHRNVPRRGQASARLLLLTFLGEARKVSRPPGRTPGMGLGSIAMMCEAQVS